MIKEENQCFCYSLPNKFQSRNKAYANVEYYVEYGVRLGRLPSRFVKETSPLTPIFDADWSYGANQLLIIRLLTVISYRYGFTVFMLNL